MGRNCIEFLSNKKYIKKKKAESRSAMGCPVSKRVQTSSDVSSNHSQNIPDENSNGLLYQPQMGPASETDGNLNKPTQNILGQTNNHNNGAIIKGRQRLDLTHTSSIFKPESTRTQSQVEFFAMLDSKIEAGEDLKEDR